MGVWAHVVESIASIIARLESASPKLSADALQEGSVNLLLTAEERAKTDRIAPETVTVPGDFATVSDLLAAYDVFPETTVTLASNVSEGIAFNGKTGRIIFEGSSFAYGAAAWIHGVSPAKSALGVGIVTLSNSGNDLTVSCATTSPDFGSLGIAAGRKLSVIDDSGTKTTETVDSVSGGTITLAGTAPTVGSSGSAVFVLPATEWSYGGTLLDNNSNDLSLAFQDVRFVKSGATAQTLASADAGSEWSMTRCTLETEGAATNASYLTRLDRQRVYLTDCAFIGASYYGLYMLDSRAYLLRCSFVSGGAEGRQIVATKGCFVETAICSITGKTIGSSTLNGSAHLAAATDAYANCGIARYSDATSRVYLPTSPTDLGNTTDTSRAWAAEAESFVVNDEGNDADFRVESDSQTHALFLDAGNSRLGINSSAPSQTLEVSDAGSPGVILAPQTLNNDTEYLRLAATTSNFAAITAFSRGDSASRLYIDSRNNNESPGTADSSIDFGFYANTSGEARVTAWTIFGSGEPVTGARLDLKRVYATTGTLSGASGTVAFAVPEGAVVRGVALKVKTALTSGDGGTTWDAALSGGASDAIGSGLAFTKNTEAKRLLWSETASATNVTVTPDAGTFSGGEVVGVCWYEEIRSIDNYA